jgi:glycosyltransferase involved in cell wall biosynthesis
MLSSFSWLIGRRYDIIEANPWISMFPVSLVGKLRGVKTTAVIHDISSGDSDQWLGSWKTAEIIEKFLIRLPFSKVICVSKGVRDNLISRYGLKEENITLIHNGVDIKLMDSIKVTTKDDNTVIFIGRLIPHKHVDDLIRAIAILKQTLPGIKLKIIGSGQEYEPLLRLVGELQLEKNVRFFGKVDYNDLIRELKKSNVLVLPSTREGFGMVLVEAFACNVPCVAYYSDGVTDVISNGGNGFLVKQRDIQVLASKIEYILKNKTKAMLFAKNGRAKTERYFSWDIVTGKVEAFYLQLKRR